MDRKYHTAVFAFIDLLGAKKLIDSDNGNFLNQLGKIYESTLRIYKLACSLRVRPRMNVKIFSDNIVFECEIPPEEDGFIEYREVAFIASIFQEELLRNNILRRGGVTIGDAYLDDVLVFGRALSEAYLLESKIAVYPRIILSPKLVEIVLPKVEGSNCLEHICVQDEDGVYYIDYLNSPGKSKAERMAFISGAIDRNNEQLGQSDLTEGIKQKLLWHNKYLLKKLRDHATTQ